MLAAVVVWCSDSSRLGQFLLAQAAVLWFPFEAPCLLLVFRRPVSHCSMSPCHCHPLCLLLDHKWERREKEAADADREVPEGLSVEARPMGGGAQMTGSAATAKDVI